MRTTALVRSSVAFLALIGVSVAFAADNWNGYYTYQRTYNDAVGKPAGEIYTLDYVRGKEGKGGKCNITMTGPQAHEDIVCRAAVSEKSATFHFVKFVNPEAAKLNRARPYKKDQQLLTFERGVSSRRPNTIRTVWHSLRTMDGKRPSGGVRFVPAKRA